ncbi:MAG: hypothetical protein ACYCVD_18670 [Desulfitobacteriaceae bacterium]
MEFDFHHHYGPVPTNHDLVQWALFTIGVIDVKPFDGPYGGEIIVALENPIVVCLISYSYASAFKLD